MNVCDKDLAAFMTNTRTSGTGEEPGQGQRDDAFGCLRSAFRVQVWAGKRTSVVLTHT